MARLETTSTAAAMGMSSTIEMSLFRIQNSTAANRFSRKLK